MIHSYPHVFALGHKALGDVLVGTIVVQEKIDGSSFSFGAVDGELQVRSKSKEMRVDAPEDMFSAAVETIKALDLHPNWVYRSEFLRSPHHNALSYGRVPRGNIIIYDINIGLEDYLCAGDVEMEAARLGLETVPTFYQGAAISVDELKSFLGRQSILGGDIEGIVVKNYGVMTLEHKVAMAKLVRADYLEVHAVEWRKANPTKQDIVDLLIAAYRTEARWEKSVQHLRDDGRLEGSPRDIGALIREAPEDVLKECRDEIADALFNHFWPHIRRGITSGLPEWYKRKLADTQEQKL